MTIWRDTLHAHGAELPTVKRESFGERGDSAPHLRRHVLRADVTQHLRDQFGHRTHLLLAEAARGNSRRAKAHAARIHRWIRVERDRIAVGGDASVFEGGL